MLDFVKMLILYYGIVLDCWCRLVQYIHTSVRSVMRSVVCGGGHAVVGLLSGAETLVVGVT